MSRRVVWMLVFVLLTISGFVVFLPVKAEARTITVPDDYSTISAAIESAMDGDTIFVKKGTYNEVLVIDKAVSLRGEDKVTTVINGNNEGTVMLIRHDNVEVTGFTVIYDETSNTPKPVWMWCTRLIGIHLLSVRNCNISGNRISDCGAGIWLYDAHQNSITDNYVVRNDYGIRVEASSQNKFSGNTVIGNWGGMWLISAAYNEFRGNSLTSNSRNLAISGSEPPAYVNDVDTSNTVESKPIYYWVNVQDREVPSDAGCVILVGCSGIKVQELYLHNNQNGILIAYSQNLVVMSNNLAANGEGVRIFNSYNVSIVGNNINGNIGVNVVGNGTQITDNVMKTAGTGIIVNGCYQTVANNSVEAGTFGSNDDIINIQGSFNTILRNEFSGQTYVGIVLVGSYNSFYENNITKGQRIRVDGDWNIIAKNTVIDSGITVSSGSNNVVCANTVVEGLGLGIGGHNNLFYANHVEDNYYTGANVIGTEAVSSGNTVYHNNFINNDQQVKKWDAVPQNFWDNGAEGNFWSDYNGSDLDMDGIGDTPYFLKGKSLDESIGGVVEVVGGQDNFPLMTPFVISSVDVELPEWEYIAPSQSPLPSFHPSLSPSPEPIQFAPPSPSPSQEPISTPEPQQEAFPETLVATASGASAAVVGVGLLVYFKKRRNGLGRKHA